MVRRGFLVDRRAFLASLTGGLLAAPLAAEAQQTGKIYRIGFLANTPNARLEDVMWQGLRERGWAEGQNFILERRYSEGRNDRHPALAAELVRLQPDLIIIVGTPAALAAKEATTTIPVVFVTVADPVGSGLVSSLAKPGGNITGTGNAGPQLLGKHLELLKEAIPSLSRVGVLINSAFSFHVAGRPVVEAAARSLGLTLTYVEVRTPEDIDGAFAEISREKPGTVLILPQPLAFGHRARLAHLALAHRVVTMVAWREAAEAGALMAYADPVVRHVRRAPYYIDRILRGAKPADLPVEEPTKFELVINAKTAKALGLTIPPSLLQRADKLIE
jgi:putative ABC transport system substrate-binding protein